IHNAFELLTRYGTTHLVFNDDIHVTFHSIEQRLWCPCPDYIIFLQPPSRITPLQKSHGDGDPLPTMVTG
ncbi:unnamed protein product, partial [Urochloa humidicola]